MKDIIFKQNEFLIRNTSIEDSEIVLSYIKKIATYEHMSDLVVATVDDIRETIYKKNQASVVIAEVGGKPIGFMLYFYTYSTFLGRANLYLEDIYIDELYRHQGYGKLMFKTLAQIAVEKGCHRIDWVCLDWNKKSIEFYENLGAKPLSDWITFRLEKNEIEKVSKI